MQAFVVRPFGTKEGINFGTIHEELIKKALKNAEIQGDTTAAVFEPGNIREDMFHVSMANYETRLNTLTWEVL